jgi:hypothetical protein
MDEPGFAIRPILLPGANSWHCTNRSSTSLLAARGYRTPILIMASSQRGMLEVTTHPAHCSQKKPPRRDSIPSGAVLRDRGIHA